MSKEQVNEAEVVNQQPDVVEEQSGDEQVVAVQDDAQQAVEEDEVVEQSLEDMQAQLTALQATVDENKDFILRGKAEIENMRRRAQRDVENAHKFAVDKFIKEILPVWDSVDLGLVAAQSEGADLSKIIEGNELTSKLFTDVMQKFNVALIDPMGETFDPEFHQAMSMVPNPDVPANTVMTVIQKGCTLNGRLMRPAMVMVSQG